MAFHFVHVRDVSMCSFTLDQKVCVNRITFGTLEHDVESVAECDVEHTVKHDLEGNVLCLVVDLFHITFQRC